ncbi:Glycosyltransferase, ALG10 [Cordyceps fumosorosea ARSEF 2679]|uniref:Dol-P-Glc:Glc(2)Man(9)GlcNAc(2)-PP-Dol alpha-1,2-glucosyltransferase n=1 Tax=Cordyceps fumosorosea (strain ARSEF 2679) TaxID=1081104 RepID=A0A162LEJ8_CORFA|nr:Glycosyltransferase, ALG10 [Cordyceps fumosorosea ARSEF 2679]OAA69534.1 Glycosyltransferase, ALG10 [Cordyceps fumosorosea ARSEF 2679]
MAEGQARSTAALVVGALLPALTTVFFNGIPGAVGGSNLPRWGVRLPILLTCAVQVWFTLVSMAVPEPYLDEIFHIPQAQKYCDGRFFDWDDKITTPPGLYFFSVAIHRIAAALRIPHLNVCDAFSLRAINFAGVLVVSYLALWCRQAIEARQHEAVSSPTPARMRAFSQYGVHTAVNVGLFPLLFFFGGLYYTDVLSTGVVLAAFVNHLSRVGAARSSVRSDLVTVVLGLAALGMRQTNVFWVVVFMGGLEAVHAVKTLRPERADQPVMKSLGEQCWYFAWRYSLGDIHDLPVHKAYPDDMIFTALSIGIAAICNPLRVVRQVWPYIATLGSFAAFVQWNGSVVLGDKSNHVATIHLAQMLYIWAFFAFFSLPLLLPSGLSFLNMVVSYFKMPASSPARPVEPSRGLLGAVTHFFQSKVLWPVYLAATTVLSLAVVRFNTVIHPFTLADNRHYMFYVFRYTIRRGAALRLALVLPYTLCRWAVWDALGGHNGWSGEEQPTAFVSHPFWTPSSAKVRRQTSTPYPRFPEASSTAESRKASEAELKARLEQDSLYLSKTSVSSSTGLVFLLATALSLITAPLVEPRYFILPWVMWRLMVPAWRLKDHLRGGILEGSAAAEAVAHWSSTYDLRLFLESAWHMAINLATGYIFLYKPYVWRAEDGTVLEGGNLQRFMW